MVRVGVAPCSPFSVSRELMRMQPCWHVISPCFCTHLAENDEDIAYSLEKFGCRPGQYAEDLGWTGDDVWHAHCVKLDGQEIDFFQNQAQVLRIVLVQTADLDRVLRLCVPCGIRA